MRYLLDTNVVSDIVRNPPGRVAQRICKVGRAQVATSITVAAELPYGAAKKSLSRVASHLDAG
ncbi:MAG TPA: PIN domain-containing protein [Terriglobales bacterium]|nr:PIN domain-containing protein [Terriglobales bacterium]